MWTGVSGPRSFDPSQKQSRGVTMAHGNRLSRICERDANNITDKDRPPSLREIGSFLKVNGSLFDIDRRRKIIRGGGLAFILLVRSSEWWLYFSFSPPHLFSGQMDNFREGKRGRDNNSGIVRRIWLFIFRVGSVRICERSRLRKELSLLEIAECPLNWNNGLD